MIGERLQELRKEKKLNQKMLADILGISEHTVSSYERNKSEPDDETKIKIAKLFDISLDYLLGLSNQNHSYKELPITVPHNLTAKDIGKIQDYINMVTVIRKKSVRVQKKIFDLQINNQ